jgi:hypothetical protein
MRRLTRVIFPFKVFLQTAQNPKLRTILKHFTAVTNMLRMQHIASQQVPNVLETQSRISLETSQTSKTGQVPASYRNNLPIKRYKAQP